MARRLIVVASLVALLGTVRAEAAVLRYEGTVFSAEGVGVKLTSTLRPAGPSTLAGRLRCESLSPLGGCLASVGSVSITFKPHGEFVAAIRLGAPCTATGVGSPGTALSGKYSCTIGGQAVDAGSFFLHRVR
jgi:hypothetical protein